MVTRSASPEPAPVQYLVPLDQVDFDALWLDVASRAVRALADTGREFSTDELLSEPFCLPEPRRSAQWGALFAKAKTACSWGGDAA